MRVVLPLPRDCPGAVECRPAVDSTGWKGPPHRHSELEMNLVVRGGATLVLGHQRYDLLPRMAVFLFPDEDHMVVQKSRDFAMWVLVFRPRIVRSVLGSPTEEPLRRRRFHGEHVRLLPDPAVERIDTDAKEIEGLDYREPFFAIGLRWLLVRGWRSFLAARDAPVRSELHPAVVKAARILQSQPEWESLADLGRVCGLSSSRLSRLFREQMGDSLVAFRTRERLRRFFALREDSPSLLAAALDAGFQSYVQFYRAFKAATGRSPQERPRQNHPAG